MPLEAIRDANDAYAKACHRNHDREHPVERTRGSYVRLTPVQHAQIAKHALAFGNKAAIRRYAREFQTEIKDSSVSTWTANYMNRMKHLLAKGE